MGQSEEDAAEGTFQGAAAGGAASGGNPIAAVAGGIFGGVTSYVKSQRAEKERKRAEELNRANIAHENLYSGFTDRGRVLNPVGQRGDPRADVFPGVVQGMEQGGKMAKLFKGSKDDDDVDDISDIDISDMDGDLYDDDSPKQHAYDDQNPNAIPRRNPVYYPPGHPSYDPNVQQPKVAGVNGPVKIPVH